jgi:hypothetical protein
LPRRILTRRVLSGRLTRRILPAASSWIRKGVRINLSAARGGCQQGRKNKSKDSGQGQPPARDYTSHRSALHSGLPRSHLVNALRDDERRSTAARNPGVDIP